MSDEVFTDMLEDDFLNGPQYDEHGTDREDNELLECADCHKKDAEVKATFCPYDDDVNNVKTPVNLCPHCEYERAMDI